MQHRPSAGSGAPPLDLRQTALALFHQALAAVDLVPVLERKLHRVGNTLVLDGLELDLGRFARIVLLAVGKAALPMAHGLLTVCDPLPPGVSLTGLVVSPTLSRVRPDPRLRYRTGTHPLPTAASLEAAGDARALLSRCGPETLVLFLVSGGASAMLEAPLDPRISLPDLVLFYRSLVHSGLPIAQMNTLRKHLSAVKGGRLAAAGSFRHATLLVSDVPAHAPDVIGSGPSLPDPSTLAECRHLLAGPLARTPLAPSVHAFFADPHCPETPKPGDPAFARGAQRLLLSSEDLCEAAAHAATAAGFCPVIDNRCDEWPYRDAADLLVDRLLALHRTARDPVCLISAGELAVPLPPRHGRGGRNQQFVLACAQRLAAAPDTTPPVAVLSAGTDGIDGNSPAAGGVVDRTTAARAAAAGLSLADALRDCNAYPLLSSLGDTVETGPSGNNLRDLRLLLSGPAMPPR